MQDFYTKFSRKGGTAPYPDPTPYPFAPHSKLLDPPLVENE